MLAKVQLLLFKKGLADEKPSLENMTN